MAAEEKAEQEVYDALMKIYGIPRPNERARICKNVIKAAALIAGYKIEFRDDKN